MMTITTQEQQMDTVALLKQIREETQQMCEYGSPGGILRQRCNKRIQQIDSALDEIESMRQVLSQAQDDADAYNRLANSLIEDREAVNRLAQCVKRDGERLYLTIADERFIMSIEGDSGWSKNHFFTHLRDAWLLVMGKRKETSRD